MTGGTLSYAFGWAATSVLVFAQGSVDLSNHIRVTPGGVDAPFFDESGTRLSGSNYAAQLYAWRSDIGFLAVGETARFLTDGYFEEKQVVIPFQVGTGPVWVQVRAWDLQGGLTFESATLAGAWSGASDVLFLPETGAPGAPPSLPARLVGLKYPGKPVILSGPQSQTVRSGARAKLGVAASSGVGARYQWYSQPNDRPDGLIPGATNAVFVTPPLGTETLFWLTNAVSRTPPVPTNLTFWVTVSNSAGSTSSDKASVTVISNLPRLTITWGSTFPLISLEGQAGATCSLQYSTNLAANAWFQLGEITLTGDRITVGDPAASNVPLRFYRVAVP